MNGCRTRIFVISLRNADERRRQFTEMARPATVPWEFFDAHTELVETLSYSGTEATLKGGRELTASELGCYSSHFTLWRNLTRDEGADRYIILEDDISVDWQFFDLLCRAEQTDIGADLLRLYFLRTRAVRELRRRFLLTSREVVELFDYGWGAQAYLLTKEGARRLTSALNTVVKPVDLAMESSWLHGVPNLAVFPFPVMETAEAARPSISDERWIPQAKPLRLKVQRALVRSAERFKKLRWRARRTIRERGV